MKNQGFRPIPVCDNRATEQISLMVAGAATAASGTAADRVAVQMSGSDMILWALDDTGQTIGSAKIIQQTAGHQIDLSP